MTTTPARRTNARPWYLIPIDLIRGFLIGMAELVPGVSGGTVALVTGIYDDLIGAANHVVQAVKRLVMGPNRAKGALEQLRRTNWWLLVPVLIGMATAVLTIAGVMKSFVTDSPELARGLFFGLVAASVIVPLRMLPKRRARSSALADVVIVLVAAVLAFILTSLAGGQVVENPPLPIVGLAAAVAICALVIPGVSGSFFLLAVGLYAPTLSAVSDRNWPYLAVFALGAVIGLSLFVRTLHYLLEHRRRGTLLAMAGLMIGSLRALWPWQSKGDAEGQGTGALLAPYQPILWPIALALLGAAIVLVLVWVEERFSTPDRQPQPRVVSASREVQANPREIFELIADPAKQPLWDANDNLQSARDGQRVHGVGEVFLMTITKGSDRENRVVEFEEGFRIAWKPSVPGQPEPGHLWRWELEPAGSGRTLVTHTYDWSALTDEQRMVRARATTEDRLAASIERLAGLVEPEPDFDQE